MPEPPTLVVSEVIGPSAMPRCSICAQQFFLMRGVDLTRIDSIDVMTTARTVVSEVGAGISKFPSDKHFASWLGLCPCTKITGGKVMNGKTKRCATARPRRCVWQQQPYV